MTVLVLATPTPETTTLLTLIARGERVLANARSAAEILEAKHIAALVYDAAKRTARLAHAARAHNGIIADAHRLQANALGMEARAKHRLADEYDAAQEQGEVVGPNGGGDSTVPKRNAATASDLGLSRKDIHDAREFRDAEAADPGVVERTLDDALKNGEEPTRAKIKRAVKAKSKRAKIKRAVKAKSKRKRKPRFEVEADSQHDRDLRMLQGVWESACESARSEFLRTVAQ